MRILLSAILVLLSFGLFAQDNEYIIHEVEQGETLYSISKRYEVKMRIIKKFNPDLRAPLRIGERIVIPIEKSDALPQSGYFEYEVKPQETLYSLSKRFGVSIPAILRINPEVESNGLKAGTKIKIPFSDDIQTDKDAPPVKGDTTQMVLPGPGFDPIELTVDTAQRLNLGESINIAVLLPLYLDENDSINANTFSSKEIYSASTIGLSYLMGLKLALDSLEKEGLNAKIYIFDTGNDSLRIQKILKNPIWPRIDYCFGPLYTQNLMWVAPSLKKLGIPVISPFSKNKDLAKRNSNVWQCHPGFSEEAKLIGRYAGFTVDQASRIVLVYQKDSPDNHLVSIVRNNMLSRNRDTLKVKEWSYEEDYIKTMNPNGLAHDSGMVYVLASTNQAFVTDFLNKISKYDHTYPRVVSFSVAEKVKSVDPFVMEKVGLRFPRYDFSSKPNQAERIEKAFKKRYYQNPDKFGMLGFDQMHYFGTILLKKGNINAAIGSKPVIKSHSGYSFKGSMFSSKVNQILFMVEYKDYQLVRVDQ